MRVGGRDAAAVNGHAATILTARLGRLAVGALGRDAAPAIIAAATLYPAELRIGAALHAATVPRFALVLLGAGHGAPTVFFFGHHALVDDVAAAPAQTARFRLPAVRGVAGGTSVMDRAAQSLAAALLPTGWAMGRQWRGVARRSSGCGHALFGRFAHRVIARRQSDQRQYDQKPQCDQDSRALDNLLHAASTIPNKRSGIRRGRLKSSR